MIHRYCPEMGSTKPANSQVELKPISRGRSNKRRVWTNEELTGSGVNLVLVLTSANLVPQSQHKVGWKEYTLTPKALDRIQEEFVVTEETLLY